MFAFQGKVERPPQTFNGLIRHRLRLPNGEVLPTLGGGTKPKRKTKAKRQRKPKANPKPNESQITDEWLLKNGKPYDRQTEYKNLVKAWKEKVVPFIENMRATYAKQHRGNKWDKRNFIEDLLNHVTWRNAGGQFRPWRNLKPDDERKKNDWAVEITVDSRKQVVVARADVAGKVMTFKEADDLAMAAMPAKYDNDGGDAWTTLLNGAVKKTVLKKFDPRNLMGVSNEALQEKRQKQHETAEANRNKRLKAKGAEVATKAPVADGTQVRIAPSLVWFAKRLEHTSQNKTMLAMLEGDQVKKFGDDDDAVGALFDFYPEELDGVAYERHQLEQIEDNPKAAGLTQTQWNVQMSETFGPFFNKLTAAQRRSFPKQGQAGFRKSVQDVLTKEGLVCSDDPDHPFKVQCTDEKPYRRFAYQLIVRFCLRPGSPFQRALINARTGSGKTRMFIDVIMAHMYTGRPICIMFPRKELLENALEELLAKAYDTVLRKYLIEQLRKMVGNLLDFAKHVEEDRKKHGIKSVYGSEPLCNAQTSFADSRKPKKSAEAAAESGEDDAAEGVATDDDDGNGNANATATGLSLSNATKKARRALYKGMAKAMFGRENPKQQSMKEMLSICATMAAGKTQTCAGCSLPTAYDPNDRGRKIDGLFMCPACGKFAPALFNVLQDTLAMTNNMHNANTVTSDQTFLAAPIRFFTYKQLRAKTQGKGQSGIVTFPRFNTFNHLSDDDPRKTLYAPGMRYNYSKGVRRPFDNMVVIFDEAHNLFEDAYHGKTDALAVIKLLKEARGSRQYFFTATPVVADTMEQFDKTLRILNNVLRNGQGKIDANGDVQVADPASYIFTYNPTPEWDVLTKAGKYAIKWEQKVWQFTYPEVWTDGHMLGRVIRVQMRDGVDWHAVYGSKAKKKAQAQKKGRTTATSQKAGGAQDVAAAADTGDLENAVVSAKNPPVADGANGGSGANGNKLLTYSPAAAVFGAEGTNKTPPLEFLRRFGFYMRWSIHQNAPSYKFIWGSKDFSRNIFDSGYWSYLINAGTLKVQSPYPLLKTWYTEKCATKSKRPVAPQAVDNACRAIMNSVVQEQLVPLCVAPAAKMRSSQMSHLNDCEIMAKNSPKLLAMMIELFNNPEQKTLVVCRNNCHFSRPYARSDTSKTDSKQSSIYCNSCSAVVNVMDPTFQERLLKSLQAYDEKRRNDPVKYPPLLHRLDTNGNDLQVDGVQQSNKLSESDLKEYDTDELRKDAATFSFASYYVPFSGNMKVYQQTQGSPYYSLVPEIEKFVQVAWSNMTGVSQTLQDLFRAHFSDEKGKLMQIPGMTYNAESAGFDEPNLDYPADVASVAVELALSKEGGRAFRADLTSFLAKRKRKKQAKRKKKKSGTADTLKAGEVDSLTLASIAEWMDELWDMSKTSDECVDNMMLARGIEEEMIDEFGDEDTVTEGWIKWLLKKFEEFGIDSSNVQEGVDELWNHHPNNLHGRNSRVSASAASAPPVIDLTSDNNSRDSASDSGDSDISTEIDSDSDDEPEDDDGELDEMAADEMAASDGDSDISTEIDSDSDDEPEDDDGEPEDQRHNSADRAFAFTHVDEMPADEMAASDGVSGSDGEDGDSDTDTDAENKPKVNPNPKAKKKANPRSANKTNGNGLTRFLRGDALPMQADVQRAVERVEKLAASLVGQPGHTVCKSKKAEKVVDAHVDKVTATIAEALPDEFTNSMHAQLIVAHTWANHIAAKSDFESAVSEHLRNSFQKQTKESKDVLDDRKKLTSSRVNKLIKTALTVSAKMCVAAMLNAKKAAKKKAAQEKATAAQAKKAAKEKAAQEKHKVVEAKKKAAAELAEKQTYWPARFNAVFNYGMWSLTCLQHDNDSGLKKLFINAASATGLISKPAKDTWRSELESKHKTLKESVLADANKCGDGDDKFNSMVNATEAMLGDMRDANIKHADVQKAAHVQFVTWADETLKSLDAPDTVDLSLQDGQKDGDAESDVSSEVKSWLGSLVDRVEASGGVFEAQATLKKSMDAFVNFLLRHDAGNIRFVKALVLNLQNEWHKQLVEVLCEPVNFAMTSIAENQEATTSMSVFEKHVKAKLGLSSKSKGLWTSVVDAIVNSMAAKGKQMQQFNKRVDAAVTKVASVASRATIPDAFVKQAMSICAVRWMNTALNSIAVPVDFDIGVDAEDRPAQPIRKALVAMQKAANADADTDSADVAGAVRTFFPLFKLLNAANVAASYAAAAQAQVVGTNGLQDQLQRTVRQDLKITTGADNVKVDIMSRSMYAVRAQFVKLVTDTTFKRMQKGLTLEEKYNEARKTLQRSVTDVYAAIEQAVEDAETQTDLSAGTKAVNEALSAVNKAFKVVDMTPRARAKTLSVGNQLSHFLLRYFSGIDTAVRKHLKNAEAVADRLTSAIHDASRTVRESRRSTNQADRRLEIAKVANQRLRAQRGQVVTSVDAEVDAAVGAADLTDLADDDVAAAVDLLQVSVRDMLDMMDMVQKIHDKFNTIIDISLMRIGKTKEEDEDNDGNQADAAGASGDGPQYADEDNDKDYNKTEDWTLGGGAKKTKTKKKAAAKHPKDLSDTNPKAKPTTKKKQVNVDRRIRLRQRQKERQYDSFQLLSDVNRQFNFKKRKNLKLFTFVVRHIMERVVKDHERDWFRPFDVRSKKAVALAEGHDRKQKLLHIVASGVKMENLRAGLHQLMETMHKTIMMYVQDFMTGSKEEEEEKASKIKKLFNTFVSENVTSADVERMRNEHTMIEVHQSIDENPSDYASFKALQNDLLKNLEKKQAAREAQLMGGAGDVDAESLCSNPLSYRTCGSVVPRVMVLTESQMEGISFFGVRKIMLVSPPRTNSEYDQAIGRMLRACNSHFRPNLGPVDDPTSAEAIQQRRQNTNVEVVVLQTSLAPSEHLLTTGTTRKDHSNPPGVELHQLLEETLQDRAKFDAGRLALDTGSSLGPFLPMRTADDEYMENLQLVRQVLDARNRKNVFEQSVDFVPGKSGAAGVSWYSGANCGKEASYRYKQLQPDTFAEAPATTKVSWNDKPDTLEVVRAAERIVDVDAAVVNPTAWEWERIKQRARQLDATYGPSKATGTYAYLRPFEEAAKDGLVDSSGGIARGKQKAYEDLLRSKWPKEWHKEDAQASWTPVTDPDFKNQATSIDWDPKTTCFGLDPNGKLMGVMRAKKIAEEAMDRHRTKLKEGSDSDEASSNSKNSLQNAYDNLFDTALDTLRFYENMRRYFMMRRFGLLNAKELAKELRSKEKPRERLGLAPSREAKAFVKMVSAMDGELDDDDLRVNPSDGNVSGGQNGSQSLSKSPPLSLCGGVLDLDTLDKIVQSRAAFESSWVLEEMDNERDRQRAGIKQGRKPPIAADNLQQVLASIVDSAIYGESDDGKSAIQMLSAEELQNAKDALQAVKDMVAQPTAQVKVNPELHEEYKKALRDIEAYVPAAMNRRRFVELEHEQEQLLVRLHGMVDPRTGEARDPTTTENAVAVLRQFRDSVGPKNLAKVTKDDRKRTSDFTDPMAALLTLAMDMEGTTELRKTFSGAFGAVKGEQGALSVKQQMEDAADRTIAMLEDAQFVSDHYQSNPYVATKTRIRHVQDKLQRMRGGKVDDKLQRMRDAKVLGYTQTVAFPLVPLQHALELDRQVAMLNKVICKFGVYRAVLDGVKFVDVAQVVQTKPRYTDICRWPMQALPFARPQTAVELLDLMPDPDPNVSEDSKKVILLPPGVLPGDVQNIVDILDGPRRFQNAAEELKLAKARMEVNRQLMAALLENTDPDGVLSPRTPAQIALAYKENDHTWWGAAKVATPAMFLMSEHYWRQPVWKVVQAWGTSQKMIERGFRKLDSVKRTSEVGVSAEVVWMAENLAPALQDAKHVQDIINRFHDAKENVGKRGLAARTRSADSSIEKALMEVHKIAQGYTGEDTTAVAAKQRVAESLKTVLKKKFTEEGKRQQVEKEAAKTTAEQAKAKAKAAAAEERANAKAAAAKAKAAAAKDKSVAKAERDQRLISKWQHKLKVPQEQVTSLKENDSAGYNKLAKKAVGLERLLTKGMEHMKKADNPHTVDDPIVQYFRGHEIRVGNRTIAVPTLTMAKDGYDAFDAKYRAYEAAAANCEDPKNFELCRWFNDALVDVQKKYSRALKAVEKAQKKATADADATTLPLSSSSVAGGESHHKLQFQFVTEDDVAMEHAKRQLAALRSMQTRRE